MKWIFSTLAGAVLAAILASCGGNDGSDATAAVARAFAAKATRLAAGTTHSFAGKTPEAACEAAFAYGEANLPQYMPHPEVTRYFGSFCYRHYAETGLYVGVVTTSNSAFNQFGIYIMGDPGSGYATSPTQVGWWDELPLPAAAVCQLMPESNGIWTTPVQIGPNVFGSWSAVTLDDRTTLVLKREQSVDPNELTVTQYNCRGEPMGSWLVASRPAVVGDISRATLYSPVIKTDGWSAWVLWRQFEPNADHSSDEVESAHIRRWTPGAGLSATVSVLPRYDGSLLDADIDVAADGSVVAAWAESVPNAPIPVHFGPRLAAAMTWSPAMGWSAPVNLSTPHPAPREDIDKITVTTPSSVQAYVAWIRQDGGGQRVEGAQLQADGSWSAPEDVFRDALMPPASIQWKVVMDHTGSTTAIWSWRTSDEKFGISYNHKSPGGDWSGAQKIAPMGSEATMSVSIARNGFGAVAWRAGYNVATVWFDQAGLIDGVYLTYEEPFMGAALFPEVVADAEGHIAVVWAEVFRTPENQLLTVARGARFSPDSGWSPNVTLSTYEAPSRPLASANSAAGMGSVLWVHGDITGGPERAGVWLAPFAMFP